MNGTTAAFTVWTVFVTVEKSLRTTDVNRNDPPDCYLLYLEK